MITIETLTWFNFETATQNAYWWSKGLEAVLSESRTERMKLWEPTYCTAMKGVPYDSDFPDDCWYVTNRFDPRRDV